MMGMNASLDRLLQFFGGGASDDLVFPVASISIKSCRILLEKFFTSGQGERTERQKSERRQ
jgi:hypothetical protein